MAVSHLSLTDVQDVVVHRQGCSMDWCKLKLILGWVLRSSRACQTKITSMLMGKYGPLLQYQFCCILRKCWGRSSMLQNMEMKCQLKGAYNETMQEYCLSDDVTNDISWQPTNCASIKEDHRPVFAECYTAVLYNNCSPSYTSDLLISWYAMVDSSCQTNRTSETVTPQVSNIVTSWLSLPNVSTTRCCCQTFCCWNDRAI